MSANNNKEELDKGAASNKPKESSSTTTTDAASKQQQPPSPPSPPSSQPKQVPAKSSTTSVASTAVATTAAAKPSAAASTAKTQPEPPPFEKGLVAQIKKEFGDLVKVVFIKPIRIKIQVQPEDIVGVANFLRDSIGFDHAESVAGTDYPKDNQIEVIYHLGSYGTETMEGHIMALATRTSRNDARLPTLINVYKSV